MAEGKENMNPVEGNNSSESSDSSLEGYDRETLDFIDYLFRSTKPEMLKQLDGVLLKKIKEIYNLKINPLHTKKYCRYPLPKNADRKTRRVSKLFQSLKKEVMEEFDDFLLKEIGDYLCKDLPDETPLSGGEANMDNTEDEEDLEEGVVNGPLRSDLDGDFLEINDLKTPLSGKKP